MLHTQDELITVGRSSQRGTIIEEDTRAGCEFMASEEGVGCFTKANSVAKIKVKESRNLGNRSDLLLD